MIRELVFLASISLSSFGVAATLQAMNKTQMEQAFIKKTLTSIPVDNLNGIDIANTFSIFLDNQGHAIGRFSNKPSNEPQVDEGVYRIKENGTLYLTWRHWDGAKELCAHFYNTQNAYIGIDCTNVFHTLFMKSAARPGNHL